MEKVLSEDQLYPDLIPQWKVVSEEGSHSSVDFDTTILICEECERKNATLRCETCQLTLCWNCTDCIHMSPTLALHTIRTVQNGDKGFISLDASRNDLKELSLGINHIYIDTVLPPKSQEAPKINTFPSTGNSKFGDSVTNSPKFIVGSCVLFYAHELAKQEKQQLHGIVVEKEGSVTTRKGEENSNYYRILYARGVVQLPSSFFQANLTFDNAWPIEVGQFSNQWHAILAVSIAEEQANAIWRRELFGGRIQNELNHSRGFFKKSTVLDELMWNIKKAIKKANIEEYSIPIISKMNIETIAHCLRENYITHPSLNIVVCEKPAPWVAKNRLNLVLVHEKNLELPEDARPRKMKNIILRMLAMYLGCSWNLWVLYIKKKKEFEENILQCESAVRIQQWIRRKMTPSTNSKNLESTTCNTDENIESNSKFYTGSAKDLANFCHRRAILISRVNAFLLHAIHESLLNAMNIWMNNSDILKKRNQPLSESRWHPGFGIKLPKYPHVWASIRNNGKLYVEDLNKYRLFKSTHAGPTEMSNWLIKDRILLGPYPEGQAFKNKKIVGRSDSISCILLQGVSSFFCISDHDEVTEYESKIYSNYRINSKKHSCLTYEDIIEKTYQSLRQELQSSIRSAKRFLNIAVGDINAATNLLDEDSIDKLYSKKMIAEDQLSKAQTTYDKVKPLKFYHFSIPRNGICALDESINIVKTIEKCLRNGENLYIHSMQGHGRVGYIGSILIGRLYGLSARDALERNQHCHDSRLSMRNRLSTRSISSPQSMCQIQMVHQVLAETDSIYGTVRIEGDGGVFIEQGKKRGAEVNIDSTTGLISECPSDELILQKKNEFKAMKNVVKRESRSTKLRWSRLNMKKELEMMGQEDVRLTFEDKDIS